MLRCLLALFALAAAAAALPACHAAPEAGPCDAVYRFENVRRDVGTSGKDEWTDIANVLKRYTKKPVPQPKITNQKSLPGGEIRTCEVAVTLGSTDDLGRVEAELQQLAAQHSGEKRLDFNLERAQMLYRSNFVAAGLEVTVRGITQPGSTVGIYTSPQSKAVRTTAGRGGAWSVRLPAVPENRYVYGFSQDPEGKARTRFFKINVVSMQQEQVAKEEFIDSVGIDPDRMRMEEAKAAEKPKSPPDRRGPQPKRDSRASRDEDW